MHGLVAECPWDVSPLTAHNKDLKKMLRAISLLGIQHYEKECGS